MGRCGEMRRRDFLRAARAALGAAAIASPALAQLGTAMPSFDRTPDKPQSFGYKVLWFAVRASDPASVLDALEFGPGTQANWASGLSAAYPYTRNYATDWVFVSPPVDGWVFVVGGTLPQPFALNAPLPKTYHEIGRRFDVLLSRLMKKFDDVQYFGTHRVVSLAAWARALQGKPVRIFASAETFTDCDVCANVGDQTPEEAKLKFPDLNGLSPCDATHRISKITEELEAEERALFARGLSPADVKARIRQNGRLPFAGESEVFDLAALWSIDPTKLSDQDHRPGLGLVAPLPKDLSQRVEIDR